MLQSPLPIVSVYIASYNSLDTLEKAVSSALSQMENLEVVIVDDCSNDGSFALAKKLSDNDSRVRVFQMEKNSGVSRTRNYAMQQARGKWLAMLDSDDWFEEGRLNKLIAEAEAADVEMVADNQYHVDTKAQKVAGTAFIDKGGKKLIDLDGFLAHSNATRHFDYGMLKPLVRADFVRKHSIEYPTITSISEDYYMLLSFFIAGGKAVVVDAPLYSYAQPFGSISKLPQKEGRKHYNHELQKSANQYFINKLNGKMSVAQMAHLQRRSREIDALIAFYNLRGSLSKRDIKSAILIVLKAPLEFWLLVLQKIKNVCLRKT